MTATNETISKKCIQFRIPSQSSKYYIYNDYTETQRAWTWTWMWRFSLNINIWVKPVMSDWESLVRCQIWFIPRDPHHTPQLLNCKHTTGEALSQIERCTLAFILYLSLHHLYIIITIYDSTFYIYSNCRIILVQRLTRTRSGHAELDSTWTSLISARGEWLVFDNCWITLFWAGNVTRSPAPHYLLISPVL